MFSLQKLTFSIISFSILFLATGCSRSQSDQQVKVNKTDSKSPASAFAKELRPIQEGLLATPLNKISSSKADKLFKNLSPKVTGLDFSYPLDISHPDKRLYQSGFATGGIAVGDLNGDGLPDIFFACGPRKNSIYFQIGPLQFEKAADTGIDAKEIWSSGVALADIDSDGDLDIYVCNYDSPNFLFINDGKGHFTEAAKKWGLDLIDACLMPSFCDYDADGDLDVFVLTNRYYRKGGRPKKAPYTFKNGSPQVLPEYQKYYGLKKLSGKNYTIDTIGRADYMLRNNGDGTFTDVSVETGVLKKGFGLSATWWDCNNDGLPDLYVANDFDAPDHLYRNNGDGTFTDALAEVLPHTSWFSMGSDSADLNNDGRFDLFVADMSATTHYCQKTTMGAMNAEKLAKVAGPPPQIMKNAIFVNSGVGRFWEAAELAGLADTDWTWSMKLADFDNDGKIDMLINNGMARSFNNSDIKISTDQFIGQTEWDMYEDSPKRPEQNLAYRNEGDLKFKDVSKDWGFDHVGISYASVYADLDRDGDLDVVTVNLDENVHLYRNDSIKGNRLLIRLQGNKNKWGIGAVVTIKTPDGILTRQLLPASGFLASNEPLIHFGLGNLETIPTIKVDWPSGHQQVFSKVLSNQYLVIQEPVGTPKQKLATESPEENPLYTPMTSLSKFWHFEAEYDDFARQPLLPNKLSQLGPGLAAADYDGDGDIDLYLSGSRGFAGRLLVNDGTGDFELAEVNAFTKDKMCEDMASLWLDVEGDGDLDLFVTSGSAEVEPDDPTLANRLYLNDGKGMLTRAPEKSLPIIAESNSTVVAADVDRDGDLDLFIGGRFTPGAYPTAPPSRLWINEEGIFLDKTKELAPGLLAAGMVTSAVWTDINNDGWIDIAVTTEWGPVRVFLNRQGKLEETSKAAGTSTRHGWFNGIAARDFDGDGDMDLVTTNFGLNTKYHGTSEKPVVIYYGDFEGSGRKRIIEAEYEGDTIFPVRGKSCSSRAMPHLKKKFTTYQDFAKATLGDIYSSNTLNNADKYTTDTLETGIWLNDGKGAFTFSPLPRLAQISPAFGVVVTEVNGDGHPDIYLVHNFFTAQVETGRMDGGMSQLFLGKGNGQFAPVSPKESGLVVPGDAKSLVMCDLNNDGKQDFVIGINKERLVAFKNNSSNDSFSKGKLVTVQLKGETKNQQGIGAKVVLHLSDNSKQTAEVSAGGGYLSQSTAALVFACPKGKSIDRIEVRWPDGKKNGPSTKRQERILVSIIEIARRRDSMHIRSLLKS